MIKNTKISTHTLSSVSYLSYYYLVGLNAKLFLKLLDSYLQFVIFSYYFERVWLVLAHLGKYVIRIELTCVRKYYVRVVLSHCWKEYC